MTAEFPAEHIIELSNGVLYYLRGADVLPEEHPLRRLADLGFIRASFDHDEGHPPSTAAYFDWEAEVPAEVAKRIFATEEPMRYGTMEAYVTYDRAEGQFAAFVYSNNEYVGEFPDVKCSPKLAEALRDFCEWSLGREPSVSASATTEFVGELSDDKCRPGETPE
jgi:hypothetical protein